MQHNPLGEYGKLFIKCFGNLEGVITRMLKIDYFAASDAVHMVMAIQIRIEAPHTGGRLHDGNQPDRCKDQQRTVDRFERDIWKILFYQSVNLIRRGMVAAIAQHGIDGRSLWRNFQVMVPAYRNKAIGITNDVIHGDHNRLQ